MTITRRVIVGLALLVALLVLIRGLTLMAYSPHTSDNYLWGAFHVHSTSSDGLGSFEEIASQARDARVAFLLMSDHGPPHVDATISKTVNGVRFIGGSEVGLPEGRLIVSDAELLPNYNLPSYPPAAARDIREWGGMVVLAYPDDSKYRWSYWDEDFTPDGIEILNLTSFFREGSIWEVIKWAGFSLFNRHYFIASLASPEYALSRWDELLNRDYVVGLYASNAHGGFRLGNSTTVPIPSYRMTLGFIGMGIEHRYHNNPELAIRSGDFFSVVRSAGEPELFEFKRDIDGRIRVSVKAAKELSTQVVLKKDGQIIAETRDGSLTHQPERGTYRAEVYLKDHAMLTADVPWILSNPIGVDVTYPTPKPDVLLCTRRTDLELAEFRVESDEESNTSLELEPPGPLRLSYYLSKATSERPERWVALALRKPLDLSASTGVYIDAKAPKPMRYRIELRSASSYYYASVMIRKGERITVPWRQFYSHTGARGPIPLSTVDTFLIEVTDSTARTGFGSTLLVERVGFCH